ncbi:MAG: DUF4406 domain-containing protein [Alistipes sp.]|nr:DUF4406 domain-containing protein [Alistipes sp.]
MKGIATDDRRIYIAGKISGLDYMRVVQKFHTAEVRLRHQGYTTVNPTRLCREWWSWLRCMVVCIWHLVRCDDVYMLTDWRDSKGARIEYRIARILGINIIYEDNETLRG